MFDSFSIGMIRAKAQFAVPLKDFSDIPVVLSTCIAFFDIKGTLLIVEEFPREMEAVLFCYFVFWFLVFGFYGSFRGGFGRNFQAVR